LLAREDDAHSPASAAGDTGIVFVNRRRDAVEIHWVSGDGRKSYGKVDAGASRFQHTFPGHRWVVTATDGRDLGTVVGESAPAVVVIADTATRPAQPAPTEPSRTKANVVRVVDHDVVVVGANGTSRRLYRRRHRRRGAMRRTFIRRPTVATRSCSTGLGARVDASRWSTPRPTINSNPRGG
jgi:hypothetical protein